MENGDCTVIARPVYKRLKVSAIRDFPEGCGPFALRIDSVPKVDIAGFGSENVKIAEPKNGDLVEGDTLITPKCEARPQYSELRNNSFPTKTLGLTIDCSLDKESPLVSSHHMDGPPLENCEPEGVQLVGMEILEDTELTRTATPVRCDSLNVSISSSPAGEVVLSGGSKSLSFDVTLAGSNACLEKAVTRRNFPRRKVSAVRDFPPLCGRNVPRLSKDEYPYGISSLENKSLAQQNLDVDDKPFKDIAASNIEEEEKTVQDGHACKGMLGDIDHADSERNATKVVKKLDVLGPASEMKSPLENTIENHIIHYKESSCHQVEIDSNTVVQEGDKDDVQAKRTSGKEIIVYPAVQSLEAKPLNIFGCQHKLGYFNKLQVAPKRTVVLSLMAKSESPWRQDDKGSSKFNLLVGTKKSKGKKVDFFARLERSKAATNTKGSPGTKPLKKKKRNAASDGMGQLIIFGKKDSLDFNDNIEEFQVVQKSRGFNVNVPPIGHRNFGGNDNDSNVTRNKVREALRLFQAVSRKLLQEVEASSKEGARNRRRIDLEASKILKEKGKYVNTGKQILGSVPGVEVGDEFHYRVELNVVGLHRAIQAGIDYMKHNGKILATSIVASGGYADDMDNSDVLIYTGQGGNVISNKEKPEDQKLERGNLALKNSCDEKNPVRVIRGSESTDGKSKTYVYDGLYVVEKYWHDMGSHGKLVFRFQLQRVQGQPELAWKEVKKSKKFKTREGLCVEDISHRIERIPICAVNTIDDENPPPFNYITSMMYPDWCHPNPSEGCNCTNGCSDLGKCSCVVKNGGEIPFNHNGAIVESKPLVFECGPSCKCPSTCHNRVSQHGIKFQLEIFKTNTRGWGVRSLNSIPSGSFICEYIGELLEENEAERRTGNDEYLFDIGNNYSNSSLWDGLSTLMPDAQSSSCEVVKNGGFTIDAAQYGNVGRFINHSCSPNLYAQNVLYDHHDNRIPHIMFFAAENIPPLQELTYDYNYMMDQVHDSAGNIKRKDCYCGSMGRTGRMY